MRGGVAGVEAAHLRALGASTGSRSFTAEAQRTQRKAVNWGGTLPLWEAWA